MKQETIDDLSLFIREIERAIEVALPDAPITVKNVRQAGKDLRDSLEEENLE